MKLFNKFLKHSRLPNTYWRTLLCEKLFAYLIGFSIILLVYKSKFLVIIFSNFFLLIYQLVTDYHQLLSDWFPYGINVDYIRGEDMMRLYNVFATNILLINIVVLLFINQNLFCIYLDSTKIFDSFKKDMYYWVSLLGISFFTFFYIFFDPTNGIINFYNMSFPSVIGYREVLLESFYNRYYLLCFYKLLAIYIAFASKDLSLGYRLLIWFLFIFLIKLAYLNSCFIVDAGLFFLIANPAIANLDYFSWKVYFDSLLAHSSGQGKKIPENYIKPDYPQPKYKVEGLYSTIAHWRESEQDLEKRHVSCRPWYDAAAACGLLEKTPSSRVFERVVVGSDAGIDMALNHKIGEGTRKNMQIWQKCMNFEPTPPGLPGSVDPTEKEVNKKTSKLGRPLRGPLKSRKNFSEIGEETNWIEASLLTKKISEVQFPDKKILSNDFSLYNQEGKQVKVYHETSCRLPIKKD